MIPDAAIVALSTLVIATIFLAGVAWPGDQE